MSDTIRALRTTSHAKWPLLPRLLAGLPLLIFGALHFLNPAAFKDILIASGFPMVDLNAVAAPAAEIAAAVFLLLGWFARIGGILGVATMVPAIYATVILSSLDPANPPAGLAQVPQVPPLPVPILVLVCSLLVLWVGAGALSLDGKAGRSLA